MNTQHHPLLLDGKFVSKELGKNLSKKISYLERKPFLAIILVGDDAPSRVYVKSKERFGVEHGFLVSVHFLPEDTTAEELSLKIFELNVDPLVDGIIVQSPLPRHLSFSEITSLILSEKDVDGLLVDSPFTPATARGIMSLLAWYEIPISGKRVTVIGRSHLVGLPVARCFLEADATVTITHSKTQNIERHTKDAEILVVGIGKPEFITKEHVSLGQVVIDVGIHRKERGLVGDVNLGDVSSLVSAITPVPGGVGPMTVVSLFENVFDAYKRRVSL